MRVSLHHSSEGNNLTGNGLDQRRPRKRMNRPIQNEDAPHGQTLILAQTYQIRKRALIETTNVSIAT